MPFMFDKSFLSLFYKAGFLICLAIMLGVLLTSQTKAHPHVFVDTRAEVRFDEQGRISEIAHSWTFDKAFSVYVIQGLDENKDEVYTREELAPLAKVNVTSLVDFDFFTYMGIEEASVEFSGPKDYWLDFDAPKNRLTLHFTLPLKEPVLVIGEYYLEIYDPEYFVAFSVPEKEAIFLAANAPATCNLQVKPAPQLDDQFAEILAQIPSDQREVPEELFAVTSQLSNTAIIQCK